MVDPLLKGFDMPLLFEPPIQTEQVPHLDAILVTHADNDHYSIPTCVDLAAVCNAYHSTSYVDSLMKNQRLNSVGHQIGDRFLVKQIEITLTPADHLWQNELVKNSRKFQLDDCCGFWIKTPDGVIWAPGDTRFMPELLEMDAPDVIFFDFSDDVWHLGLDNALKIANAYPNAQLLLSHWGSVDAPNMAVFNADPNVLLDEVIHPERIRILQPGAFFTLCSVNPPKTMALSDNAACEDNHQTTEMKMENKTIEPVMGLGEKIEGNNFSGNAWLKMLSNEGSYDCNVYNVTFAPTVRNSWHSHAVGQILLCTEGVGYYQERGKAAQKLEVGDVVNIPADVEHWHGAAPDSPFTHIGITPKVSENTAQWLEPVTDEAYAEAVRENE